VYEARFDVVELAAGNTTGLPELIACGEDWLAIVTKPAKARLACVAPSSTNSALSTAQTNLFTAFAFP